MNKEYVRRMWEDRVMLEHIPADWFHLRQFFRQQLQQCFLDTTRLSDSVIEFVVIPYLQHAAGECVCSTIYCARSKPKYADVYIRAEVQLQVWGQDHDGYCSGADGEFSKIDPYTLSTSVLLQTDQWMTYLWCQVFDKHFCITAVKNTQVHKWLDQFQLDAALAVYRYF